MPADWFVAPPEITIDREEITVVGPLSDPPLAAEASAAELAAAAEGRARRFREETRSCAWRSPARPSTGSAARSPGA